MELLKARLGVNFFKSYVIGKEKHADGSPHLHVFGCFPKNPDFKNCRIFDLVVTENERYHPNIRRVGVTPTDRQNAGEYCMKDSDYSMHGLDFFSNSKDFRKKYADQQDWFKYLKMKQKQDPVFPVAFPARLHLEPMTGVGKQRHVWIIAPPNCGKTTWVEQVFANKNVFHVAAKANKPFDNYAQEQVIVYDDHFPSFEEIISISNVYKGERNILGDQRYFNKQWKANQQRVIIVLSNHEPQYGQHMAAVESRFRFIYLQQGQLLFDPLTDENPYAEEE